MAPAVILIHDVIRRNCLAEIGNEHGDDNGDLRRNVADDKERGNRVPFRVKENAREKVVLIMVTERAQLFIEIAKRGYSCYCICEYSFIILVHLSCYNIDHTSVLSHGGVG